jgi:hypothetical protein
MAKAVWVPVSTGTVHHYSGARVRNRTYVPLSRGPDLTNVHLDPAAPTR